MNKNDRKNIIEFYETQVWLPGMPKSDILTDKYLMDLKNTLWFSRWMLSVKYDECVKAINRMIRKLKLKNK